MSGVGVLTDVSTLYGLTEKRDSQHGVRRNVFLSEAKLTLGNIPS